MTSEDVTFVDVLSSPAEIRAAAARGFAGDTCVVFDVLRATSVMITGLWHGANGYVPVEEIADAIVFKWQNPEVLLAGERGGLKITADQSGGVEFDLGNSPREHMADKVAGKTIVSTTTNGTRAIRACIGAGEVLVGSFLNLEATAVRLLQQKPARLILVCAGTGDDVALEDVLGAGALIERLVRAGMVCEMSDSARLAAQAFESSKLHLSSVAGGSANGRRLSSQAELRDDVEYCLRTDVFPIAAALDRDGVVRKV